MFRNFGIYNSDAGEIPKRKHNKLQDPKPAEIILRANPWMKYHVPVKFTRVLKLRTGNLLLRDLSRHNKGFVNNEFSRRI